MSCAVDECELKPFSYSSPVIFFEKPLLGFSQSEKGGPGGI